MHISKLRFALVAAIMAFTVPAEPVAAQICFPGSTLCYTVTSFSIGFDTESDEEWTYYTATMHGLWSQPVFPEEIAWELQFENSVQLMGAPFVGGWGRLTTDGGYANNGRYAGAGIYVDRDPYAVIRYMEVDDASGRSFSCGSMYPGGTANPCSVVPEPTTVVLLASGLIGIGVVAWRRKREEEEDTVGE